MHDLGDVVEVGHEALAVAPAENPGPQLRGAVEVGDERRDARPVKQVAPGAHPLLELDDRVVVDPGEVCE